MPRKTGPHPDRGKPDLRRTIWTIPDGDPDLYIVRERELRDYEDPLDPAVAYPILDRWAADHNARAQLLALYDGFPAPHLGFYNLTDWMVQQTVKLRLREAFRRGQLLLIRLPPLGIGPGAADALIAPVRTPAAPPPPRQAAKTWVEVRLVDMEGHPVGGKHYLIKTPSGAVEEGNLDSSGRVRLNNIDPGTCMIGFPDLDCEAWERAN